MTPEEQNYFCDDELLTGKRPRSDARLMGDVLDRAVTLALGRVKDDPPEPVWDDERIEEIIADVPIIQDDMPRCRTLGCPNGTDGGTYCAACREEMRS